MSRHDTHPFPYRGFQGTCCLTVNSSMYRDQTCFYDLNDGSLVVGLTSHSSLNEEANDNNKSWKVSEVTFQTPLGTAYCSELSGYWLQSTGGGAMHYRDTAGWRLICDKRTWPRLKFILNAPLELCLNEKSEYDEIILSPGLNIFPAIRSDETIIVGDKESLSIANCKEYDDSTLRLFGSLIVGGNCRVVCRLKDHTMTFYGNPILSKSERPLFFRDGRMRHTTCDRRA